ncbi:GD10617 [Drosophila simulans]|uniref:GD10617 n=1 Tax=Drosophila simulans TaxID=7240 RepID=B4QGN9_DROSI|nr:GD10617 [Drosophila simulans]
MGSLANSKSVDQRPEVACQNKMRKCGPSRYVATSSIPKGDKWTGCRSSFSSSSIGVVDPLLQSSGLDSDPSK